jgi:hypothetical protein
VSKEVVQRSTEGNSMKQDYIVEFGTHRGFRYVVYGKNVDGKLSGPSMCVWMVPGTWSE